MSEVDDESTLMPMNLTLTSEQQDFIQQELAIG